MASFSICVHRQFCQWPYHLSFKNFGLCPDMTMTSETLSDRGSSVHSVFQVICIYLHEVLRKVIHQCRRVQELLNKKCIRKTVVMMGKTKSRTLEVSDYPEPSIWYSEMKMAAICEKTQTKVMIRSDQMVMAGALLSEWRECQSEEQDDDHERTDDEWSGDEDEGISGMSSENRELWEYFLKSDPSNLLHVSYSTNKDASDQDTGDEESDAQCPQEKDEADWSEEDSDWSEEGDAELSPESRELWESFNNLYNPFCFSHPIGVPGKRFELEHNLTPSSQTASEVKNNHSAEQNTKQRTKKVRFSDGVTIHYLDKWDCASQAARDGSCWLELARDRARFRRRVDDVGAIISPCLSAQHRASVLDRLSKHSDGVLQFHNGQKRLNQEDCGSCFVIVLWCLCVFFNLMCLLASYNTLL